MLKPTRSSFTKLEKNFGTQFEQKKYRKSAQSLIQIESIRNTGLGLRAMFYPKSIYLLAKVFEQLGDRKLALKNYKKLLEMWKNADEDLPQLIDAKARLAKLLKDN